MLHNNFKMRVKNFRGFRDTGEIDLKPLTILVGSNNVGKSSFLAPIIMLKETVASADAEVPIVSRGKSFDFGSFADFIREHSTKNKLEVTLGLHVHDVDEYLKGSTEKDIGKVGDRPPGEFKVEFSYDERLMKTFVSKYTVYDFLRQKMLELLFDGDGYKIEFFFKNEFTDEERTAIYRTKPVNFFFSPSRTIYQLKNPSVEENSGRGHDSSSNVDYSSAFESYLTLLSYSFEFFTSEINDFHHIGPSRNKPKRIYEFLGDRPQSVGDQGENAASIIRRDYPEIKSELNRWIKKMGLGKSLEMNEITQEVFSLSLVSQNGRTHNIADLGFGISQFLPILVHMVTADETSLTLIEQPELHLNPKLQRNLGDFFVQMAKDKKRLIVETHSEHLLLRVRTLIAQKKIPHEDVGLYFVEKYGKSSKIREIDINALGHINKENWPKDFFADKLAGSLELAQAQRAAISKNE